MYLFSHWQSAALRTFKRSRSATKKNKADPSGVESARVHNGVAAEKDAEAEEGTPSSSVATHKKVGMQCHQCKMAKEQMVKCDRCSEKIYCIFCVKKQYCPVISPLVMSSY
jgi:hypothetical protein